MKIIRTILAALLAAGMTAAACGCSAFKVITGGETLRILSGSENEELEQILEECEKSTGVNIEMTYKGSVDIMQELKNGAPNYDAVWTASSLWISLGDEMHIVKHDESISTSPVIFGIKQSVAEELGFTSGEVSVKDILAAIEDGKLTFCMTSATQSNSGASAYIGFLYALLGKSSALTYDDLSDPALREQIKTLLSGVERSSGSSGWLEDMFLAGDYDAMVNYECLIIDADRQLTKAGKEPLYAVYPYDGLSIADSPLGYLDHGDDKKEEAFLKVQEYLLSDEAQTAIEATGRRISLNGVSEQNKEVFNKDWGIDTERILSPITMPAADVLMNALNLWQSSFRKPSLTVYCLDYSGSMYGEGNYQLVGAMEQVLVQENAQANLLQAGAGDINIVVTFDDSIGCQRKLADFADRVLDNSGKDSADTAEQLQALIEEIKSLDAGAAFKDTFWARLPVIGSRARRMKKLKKRFAKARIRIERLEQELERSRVELLRGAELFDVLGQENSKCFRQLTLYIQAGKEQLEYLRTTAIPKLSAEVERQNDPMAAQLLYGFQDNLSRFESRIHDLELSRTIALQSAPQMKLIQNGNSVMAQKIQSAVLNTIPIWKNQYAAAVGLTEQTAVYKTQRELDKITNAMLLRNAEILRQSAAQTAYEARRGGVDTEALKKANDSLIRSIEDALRLSRESTMRHREAEAELGRIEHQLQNALSQVR